MALELRQRERPFDELHARGAEYYPTLLARLGEIRVQNVAFRRSGALVVSADPSELDAFEERLRRRHQHRHRHGRGVTPLRRADPRAVSPLAGRLAAVHLEGGARVDGRAQGLRLLEGARRHGAAVHCGAARLADAGGGRVQVHVHGDEPAADAVVVAGAFAHVAVSRR